MTLTTNEDIERALLKCYSSFTPVIGKVYENQTYNPNIGVPYLRTWFLPAETDTITLGPTGVNEYTGIFQVRCVYPKGAGVGAARTMAGKICSHFYRGRQITYNNILVKIWHSWPDPGDEDGEFYVIPVRVLYYCWDNAV